MYDELIKKILEYIDENSTLTATYPKFSGEGYKAYKIDINNFHQITKSNSDKKIAFVDGGNAEIIGSANFSLNLIRICYVIYQNNKKILTKKLEFFAFINAVNQNNEIYYKASFFDSKNSNFLNEMSFNSFDHTLMLGINRAEISSVANAIRRFAELKMAKIISEKDNFCDIIVLDGNLQSTLTNENKYLNELYESCSKNNVILTALSKTTSLFTENGNLLSVVLDNISTFPSWYYYSIVEINNTNHKAKMFFVKFHNKSKHIFRFEIFNMSEIAKPHTFGLQSKASQRFPSMLKNTPRTLARGRVFDIQKSKAEETINTLANYCTDPIFIGYPYGLVEADRIARISNHEKGSLKTMFLVKLINKNIEKYLSSVNAHEILDRISF